MLINFCLPCFPQLSGENKSCLLPCPSSLILSTLTDSLKYIKIWEMYWVAGNWNHKTNYKAPHKKKKLSLFRMKLSDLSQITSIIISYSHRSRAYCQQTSLFQLMWIHEKFFFFFSFCSCTCSIWKFLGQGLNQSCSCQSAPQPQQHGVRAASVTYATACGHTRSLTHQATMRTPVKDFYDMDLKGILFIFKIFGFLSF